MLSAARTRLLPSLTALAAASAAVYAYGATDRTGYCSHADAPDATALSPNEWRAFKLIEKQKLTHNTYNFRFELPDNKTAGLNVASCLITKALLPNDKGEPSVVVRPYTPVSKPDTRGVLDLVVKVYPTGNMSKHIGGLQVGDTLEMKGPIPKYPYKANLKANIGMVAGGTGITPMLQVLEAIVDNPKDNTQVSIVYANVSEDDILLKGQLDALAAKHPNFTVHYVVDKPKWMGAFWRGGVGYITDALLKQKLPPPGPDNLIMVCGPPGMINAISGDKGPDRTQGELKGLLKQLGYSESQVFKF